MTPDVQSLQDAIRSGTRTQPRGAQTKTAPVVDGATTLALSAFSGVIDYQPSEFIITAWAGTPVRDVVAMLAERGQYLPFDPLLVERGATLGGTVASNACGPERYRYGGARDFLIGTHFVDGNGDLLRGGGKVVKNAAGFDYPKLMVGSLGTLGVLVDVTFKVFPRPEAYATLVVECPSLADALALLPKLTNCQYDINAIDVVVETRPSALRPFDKLRARDASQGASLQMRVGGLAAGLPQRMDRVRALCGAGDVITGEAEAALWREAGEFGWVAADELALKVPITPSRIPDLDARLSDAKRRYSVGGNVAWVALSKGFDADALLAPLGLQGLILFGAEGDPRVGLRPPNAFAERVKRALDPQRKFG